MSLAALIGRRGGGPLTRAWQPNRPAWATVGFDSPLSGMSPSVPNESGLLLNFDAFQDTDASAPFSPPDVVRIQYAGNDLGNGQGGGWIYSNANYAFKRMYMCIACFFPTNYVTHSNQEKFWYPIIGNGPATACNINGLPTGPNIGLALQTQSGLGPQSIQTPAGTSRIVKGGWHVVEVIFEMNTPGVANGVWRAWVNNEPHVERTDIGFDVNGGAWQTMRWTGTRGGGAAEVPTPPEGQRRFYDRVSVWGSTT